MENLTIWYIIVFGSFIQIIRGIISFIKWLKNK